MAPGQQGTYYHMNPDGIASRTEWDPRIEERLIPYGSAQLLVALRGKSIDAVGLIEGAGDYHYGRNSHALPMSRVTELLPNDMASVEEAIYSWLDQKLQAESHIYKLIANVRPPVERKQFFSPPVEVNTLHKVA